MMTLPLMDEVTFWFLVSFYCVFGAIIVASVVVVTRRS